ncbi:MAG: ATP-binding cassette domain-containing protein, partial [Cyanobacteria bacterium J06649_5]
QSLSAFGAGIDRLYDFATSLGGVKELEKVEEPVLEKDAQKEDAPEEYTQKENTQEDVSCHHPVIRCEMADELALQNLTLQTPNYQRTLIENLSLVLDAQSSLLVVGPSGCGKSSLMRAIAGLWNSGTGVIQRPQLEHLLFLPQKPYMILGSLRQQLLYPYPEVKLDDNQLKLALQQVNLPD